jgi:hypothetical protein
VASVEGPARGLGLTLGFAGRVVPHPHPQPQHGPAALPGGHRHVSFAFSQALV